MQEMKQKKGNEKSLGKEKETGSEQVRCLICGRNSPAESCIWEEDKPGVCCNDCRAELNSCGCSD